MNHGKREPAARVSVVIPAFNAAATLRETLQSAADQTYPCLEIIVVDDGSTDDTAAVAEAFRAIDPRITLVRTPNGGVASARNAGIAASKGEFIAFLDADDLWHPTKIAKQVAALIAAGDETALVYAPFRRIDAQGMVQEVVRNHRAEGWVINRLFFVNLVGNGSSILARRHILEEIGGYSSELRQLGAQGCEDMLLQLRVAFRYKFATVPEYLVGYRLTPDAMSADAEKMARSALLALEIALANCANASAFAARGLLDRLLWQYLKASVQKGRLAMAAALVLPHLKARWHGIARAAGVDFGHKLHGLVWRLRHWRAHWRVAAARRARRHFYEYDPAEMWFADHLLMPGRQSESDFIFRGLRALAPLDAAYRPEACHRIAASGAAEALPDVKRFENAGGTSPETPRGSAYAGN